MRLTCPNCDAQYEVPDEVIPTEGRDVQCSNCGHTWFQPPAGAPMPEPSDTEDETLPPGYDDDDDEEYEDEPRQTGPDHGQSDAYDDDYDDEEAPAEPAPGGQAARGLDPDISDILRQEAARETQLRAREAEALESQPDLGLDAYPGDEPKRRAREAQDRMARIRGEEPETEDEAAGSRRGLLPDIEEINSTLRGADAVTAAPAPVSAKRVRKRRSGGFMRGLTVMLLFGAVLFLLYANAPQIARSVPQADPMLSAYVALVDQARLWLDAQAAAFVPRP
ncbi:zinc-ribbon domain-containing protein [Ruegeria aquimaris]|uniref:Zinc-ribbon domain-containing protein n=1 Tax=Ruegeria aquimaris TaxID=2984333 RepID=A0ABT3AHC1_9RHOB|nr:zinc-ribbon domain-containing protein [Ruegeria sp. XHP0148]MCV2888064.1 zinc-ribbon domain-containing protein [Ruegeria sp. XHP0148]